MLLSDRVMEGWCPWVAREQRFCIDLYIFETPTNMEFWDKPHYYSILKHSQTVQAFYATLKNIFILGHIREHIRQYQYICNISADNFGKPIYRALLFCYFKNYVSGWKFRLKSSFIIIIQEAN